MHQNLIGKNFLRALTISGIIIRFLKILRLLGNKVVEPVLCGFLLHGIRIGPVYKSGSWL